MRNRFGGLWTALLLITLSAPVALSAQTGGSLPVNRLSPGDFISIEVWRQGELSGQFPIGRDGTILHPLYRDLRVAGIPMEEVEVLVRSFLLQFESSPRFVVRPLLAVQVTRSREPPQILAVQPETTVLRAIFSAGGPGERGQMDRIRLYRDGEETVLNLRINDPDPHFIQSGDEIFIPQRRSIFRDYIVPFSSVTGAVFSIINFYRLIR
jgi:protein involved in polysaccharide export with SLBB domain